MARNGLVEIGFPGTISLLDGTLAHSALAIAGEHAVAPIYYLRHQIALLIYIAHTLLLYHLACLWHKVVPHHGNYLFQLIIRNTLNSLIFVLSQMCLVKWC